MILVNNVRSARTILTLYGPITYERTFLVASNKEQSQKLYDTEGIRGVFPKDWALGIDRLPFKATYKMMAAVCREGVRAKSYAEAVINISEKYHVKISAKQVEKITNYVGKVVWDDQRKKADVSKATIGIRVDNRKRRRRKDDILYIEIDGAYVHVRDKQDGGSTKAAWTESKHAIAFHSSDIHYWHKKNSDGEFNHRIEAKDCTGYIGSSDEFKYHLHSMAAENDCEHVSKVVFICDGALWIKEIVEKYFPYATYILDLYHAKEHAGNFARVAESDSVEADKLADKLCDLIDAGKIEELLDAIRPYKEKKLPEGANFYTYVENHRSGMNYPYYREQGYFVGSGAVESANRYLMQNRLKLPGMRWNTSTAQLMLSLKVKEESGNWNSVINLLKEHF